MKWCRPFRLSVRHVLSLFVLLPISGADLTGQNMPAPEELHGVASRRQLAPPLRSQNASLRFSHDGRYLLLQDSEAVYLLSRSPLRVIGEIVAPKSYAARFSADSQSIVMVSLALTYQRWSVQEGKLLENKVLPIEDGCVDAQLSPDGSLLACYRPDFSLEVWQLGSNQRIFTEKLYAPDPHVGVIPIDLDLDVPFGGAFSFTLTHDMSLLVNRGVCRLAIAFSPSGATLVAGDPRGAARVNTVARTKAGLPSVLVKLLAGSVSILDDARVLAIPVGKPAEPAIRSLSDGKILAPLDFKADSADLATDMRYALLHNSGELGAGVFDLQEKRAVETPPNIAADLYDGELAVASPTGDVSVFRQEQALPIESVPLPIEDLSPLHGVAVSSDLTKIAISGEGESALFDIATGRRISQLPQFSFFAFSDSSSAYLLTPDRDPTPAWELEYQIDRVDAQRVVHASPLVIEATHARRSQTIWRVDSANGSASRAWNAGETRLRAGGPVLFEYSFEGLAGHGLFLPHADSGSSLRGLRLPQGAGPPFQLRALGPVNGQELWSRSFGGLSPVPFADPQGERLILSWQAKNAGASTAVRQNPAAANALKKAKLTDQDSFLEVLDARSGKSLGGALVQSGASPANFDMLFSVGPAIIFSRDPGRIQVYSLSDGQLQAKLHGTRPAANARSGLLAVEAEPGRLVIYDLNTLAELDEQIFSDAIAYMHFSLDGQRLLVLTENQSVFVLDVKEVGQPHT